MGSFKPLNIPFGGQNGAFKKNRIMGDVVSQFSNSNRKTFSLARTAVTPCKTSDTTPQNYESQFQ